LRRVVRAVVCVGIADVFNDRFSGPVEQSVGCVCVCVCAHVWCQLASFMTKFRSHLSTGEVGLRVTNFMVRVRDSMVTFIGYG